MPGEMRTVLNDLTLLEDYIDREIKQRMQERGVPYRDALLQIADENRALFKLREALRDGPQKAAIDLKTYQIIEGQLVEVEDQLDKLIAEAKREHPEFTAGQALKVAASEHPEMWRRREELRRQLHG